MKAATSSKPEGNTPAKKVVKKVAAKAGASPVATKPAVGSSEKFLAPKKDTPLKSAATPAKASGSKTEETNAELKTDLALVSNAQVALKPEPASGNNAENKNVAVVSKKLSDLNNPGEKPKTKTVIVKKKVLVTKKSAASAAPSGSKPSNNSNTEKLVNLGSETTQQQIADTGRDGRDLPLENSSLKEKRPASIASEKPQKVVKKVVVKGKGGAMEAKKDNNQNSQAAVERNIETRGQQKVEASEKTMHADISKNSTQEAALRKEEDPEELETDNVDECETMDIAAEELQLYDNNELEEEPELEEVVDEDVAEIGEGVAQTRPVSDRQKRKKLEVFVGGLDKDASEDDIRAAFKAAGEVIEVRLMMNPLTGKNKGYAFVRFASAEQAGRAATEFASMQIRGKECGVLPNQDNDTLFIGNISRDWKSSEVLQKLKEFGVTGVEELTLIADPQNEALNRGYAFLELATHYDAVNAFQRLHRPGVMFGYDRPAKVSWAQPLNDADTSIMSKVKSVFVDGIPPNWTDDKVKQSFGKFGDIERIVFARNMPFAKRKDFAFVNFTSSESASTCVEAFRETELSDGDRKVKVKVSLTRLIQKGRADKWSTFRHRGPPGQVRGQGGRGEGWSSMQFSSRGGGRGLGWSGSHGLGGRGGKRLYDEDEVRMMLKAVREEESGQSTARGRGGRHPRTSRGMARGGYARDDESLHHDTPHAEIHREQTESHYMHDGYHNLVTSSRGKAPRPGNVRDDYDSQHLGLHSRSRVSQQPGHFRSVRHEDAHDQRYEQGPVYDDDEGAFAGAHDYKDVGVGMKRPAASWDEDYSYYESGHRGNPRARADYSDSVHFPENVTHYSSHMRSPVGPATQALGMRQAKSAKEGPMSSFYDTGSGLGKAGVSSTYDGHNYNTVLPEISHYLSEVPERRETSMYPSSFCGGHSGSGGYDFQTPGYY